MCLTVIIISKGKESRLVGRRRARVSSCCGALNACTGTDAGNLSHAATAGLTAAIAYRVPASPRRQSTKKDPKPASFTIGPGVVLHGCRRPGDSAVRQGHTGRRRLFAGNVLPVAI